MSHVDLLTLLLTLLLLQKPNHDEISRPICGIHTFPCPFSGNLSDPMSSWGSCTPCRVACCCRHLNNAQH